MHPSARRRQQVPFTQSEVPQQVVPLHAAPSGMQQRLRLQTPVQHGSLFKQLAPTAWQHWPLAQLPVVHWAPASQGPPTGLWHTPLHRPPQQSLKLLQPVPV
jgi:hypothetical protein